VKLSGEQELGLARLRHSAPGRVDLRVRREALTPRMLRGRQLQRAAGAGAERSRRTARAFLATNRELLRIDDPDGELVLRKEQRDELGRTHLRFQQRYRGLRVWPAELIVHLDPAGNVDLMNGAYVETPRSVPTRASLSAADSVELARKQVPDGESAPTSTPELFLYAPGDTQTRLAWDVLVEASFTSHWRVVIDARSGVSLMAYNTVMSENVSGSGRDLGNQTQAFNVWQEGGTHFLVDTSRPMYDPTSDPPQPNVTRGAIIITDAANQPPTDDVKQIPELGFVTSDNPSSGWLADGVSAMTNLGHVYEYFRTVHDRNSLDGSGGSLLAAVRIGANFQNAFYMSEQNLMAFGDGEPYAAALDVVAHELSHGVTFHSANLVYKDEPGALNESFSDVFGESVEAQVRGSADWLIGSAPLSTPLRNMQNPGSIVIPGLNVPYPAKYSDYIQTSQDNGGVHLNSSIPNVAFYQLAEGLPNAVGIAKAEKIFYRGLTVHLSANSQFIDARLACVQAAEELYSAGSAEAQATAAAFDSVEIFDGAASEEPTEFPSVDGPDATLFLRSFFDFDTFEYYDLLARQEPPVDDPLGGVLSFFDARTTRPSVTGDGSLAAYVDAWDDLCLIVTDGSTQMPSCLGFNGLISSVAMSPDGNRYGFVLLDVFGDPDNVITVIDLRLPEGQGTFVYELLAPAFDGQSVASVRFADAMDFSSDGRLLIYDALNQIQFLGGGVVDIWSLYALDTETGATFTIVPPIEGLDIGFPALSQTSDNFVTFEVQDQDTGESYVYAGNLDTGDFNQVGYNASGFAAPSFTGDDSGIVYSWFDGCTTETCYALVHQSLQTDRITAAGDATFWIDDAYFGVVYRRGTFVPEPGAPLQQLAAFTLVWQLWRRRRSKRSPC